VVPRNPRRETVLPMESRERVGVGIGLASRAMPESLDADGSDFSQFFYAP